MRAGWAKERWGWLVGAWLLVAATAAATAQPAIPTQVLTAELQALAAHAGTIFVGQITSIQRKGGVVEVSFRVEQQVRGNAGSTFVMREWAGNWAPGQMRYTVGARVLAFVHGASGAGFSSPVHGPEGLVPVIVQGANAPALLDLRRVAASVVRAPGTPLPTEADGALPLPGVLATLTGSTRASSSSPVRGPLPARGGRPTEAPWMWKTQSGDDRVPLRGKPLRATAPGEVLQ